MIVYGRLAGTKLTELEAGFFHEDEMRLTGWHLKGWLDGLGLPTQIYYMFTVRIIFVCEGVVSMR